MKQKGFIFAVFALGLGMRIVLAQTKDFWFDEAFSFYLAKNSLLDLLYASASDNNPPFYYLLLHFWMKFGESEFFLRLPSLIFGLVSVFLIYHVAKEFFSQKIAIISSLLLVVSPPQIYYSAETRMYSLWFFLTLALVYFFLKILKSPKPSYYLLFALCSLLSLYTHYFSVLVLGSFAFYLVVKRKRYSKLINPFMVIYGLVFLAFLPWLVQFLSSPHAECLCLSAWEGIPATFISFVLGGAGDITLKTMFLANVPSFWKIIFTTLIILTFSLLLLNLKKTSGNKNLSFFYLFIALPIVVITFISFFTPIFSPRTFFVFSFAFYILLARGITAIKNSFLSQITLLSILLLSLLVSAVPFLPPFEKEPLKKAAAFIQGNYQKDDLIIHKTIFTYFPFRYYHQQRLNEYLVLPEELKKGITQKGDQTFNKIEEIGKDNRRIWFINIPHRANPEDIQKTKNYLDQNYKMTKEVQYETIEIRLYE